MRTIYQGPNRPSIMVRSGTVLKRIKIEQARWSLLRTFFPLEWNPAIVISGHDVTLHGCHIKARGTAVQVIPEVVQDYRVFTRKSW